MADEQTQEKRTWTKHTFLCQSCHERCYASQEAIDMQREAEHGALGETDEQIAEGFDFCLSCVDGNVIDGEKVPRHHRRTITSAESQQYIDGDPEWLKGPVWELRGLTPEDVNMLEKLVFGIGDRPEHWGDAENAVKKIRGLVDAVKSSGVWPQPKEG